MKTGIVYDPVYLDHDTGSHPENSRRLVAIMSLLEESGLLRELTSLPPRMATVGELLSVHSPQLVEQVESLVERGGGWLDGDTVASNGSYKAALYAVGGLLRATDAVLSGEVDSAFALVRPPGHHATQRRAMGFCLFNNIAIAAKYALEQQGLERVMIVDFDVHHGNGTQAAFYEDGRVLYFSTHQYPHYPGSGDISEMGSGAGSGKMVNIPLPGGCGDDEYHRIYSEILPPLARRFNPQMILVSAGYDVHWSDQLAGMQLTVSGIADVVGTIKGLAEELCQGRLLITLEGGYSLEALAYGVKDTFGVLLGHSEIDDPLGDPGYRRPAPSIEAILDRVSRMHQIA